MEFLNVAKIQTNQENSPENIKTTKIKLIGRVALLSTVAVLASVGAKSAQAVENTYPNDGAQPTGGVYEWWVDENSDGKMYVTPDLTDNDEAMSSRGYYYKNCTDYAAWRIKNLFDIDIPGLGSASTWDTKAIDKGYTVNYTPEVGDVAQDNDSAQGTGHVAIVEKVNKDASGNIISIETSDYNGDGDGQFNGSRTYSKQSNGNFSDGSLTWDNFIDINGEGIGSNASPETQENGDPFGNIDKVRRYPGGLRLEGWVMDPDTQQPIDAHVYSGDGYAKSEQYKGWFNANIERKDIDIWNNGSNHGFVYDFLLEDKQHTICLYGINKAGAGKNRRFDCVDQTLSGNGVGQMDQFFRSPGGVTAKGWAFDPDTDQANEVHFYEGGTTDPSKLIGGATANKERKDVFASLAGQYVGYSDYHGFDKSLALTPGYHKVCAYSLNKPGTSGETKWMNCSEITIFNDPKGYLESLTRSGGTVSLRGWVLDPDVYGAVNVHVYGGDGSVNSSKFMSGFAADLSRPDIVAGNPGYGDKHGYEKTLTLPSGTWRVCVYALNAPGTPGGNLVMGCKNV